MRSHAGVECWRTAARVAAAIFVDIVAVMEDEGEVFLGQVAVGGVIAVLVILAAGRLRSAAATALRRRAAAFARGRDAAFAAGA